MLAASFALITVLARYLNSGFTIAQQVYLRTAAAFVMSGIIFSRFIRWHSLLRIGRREWTLVIARAVLFYAVCGPLYSKAATLTLIGDVSFIAALPLVSVLALLLRQVAATRRRIVCVLGSVAGVAAVSLHGAGRGSPLPVWDRGDLLALLAMLAAAVSYLGRSWHDGSLNNAELTFLTLGVGAVCMALVSSALGEGAPHLAQHGPLWGAIALAGLLSVVNVFLINYGFELVDPVTAGNLLTLESVWGLAFGLLFYRQWPTAPDLAGGAMIVGSAIGMNSAPDRAPDPT